MSIEIGSKLVKDGEVVEVVYCEYGATYWLLGDEKRKTNIIWYKNKNEHTHVSTESDFLEQYKEYTPVYEYKWVQIRDDDLAFETDGYYSSHSEMAEKEPDFWNICPIYKLHKTKRERKQ